MNEHEILLRQQAVLRQQQQQQENEIALQAEEKPSYIAEIETPAQQDKDQMQSM